VNLSQHRSNDFELVWMSRTASLAMSDLKSPHVSFGQSKRNLTPARIRAGRHEAGLPAAGQFAIWRAAIRDEGRDQIFSFQIVQYS